MFQTLWKRPERRNCLRGCALGVFIGSDEQDTASHISWKFAWMLGRLEEPQICDPCLFKPENYIRYTTRAQGSGIYYWGMRTQRTFGDSPTVL